MELNTEKLQSLLGVMVNELGAAQNAALVIVGDELDLYRKMMDRGPVTAAELAKATNTRERYVQEWLSAQAASGFVGYDAETETFELSPEQAAVFAIDDSPVNMVGGFQALDAVFADRAKLTHAFRHGGGVSWKERCSCMFCGTDRFFRPGYKANLIQHWLPSLEGVIEKLESGALVADVGCGFGSSTLLMAKAFPNSEFIGIDFHGPSIEHANEHAKGIANVRFATARAQDFEGEGFDLVTIFDALHDMGDPVGAIRHIAKAIETDGTLMVVEPMAGDHLSDNLNPVGRVFYAASANTCVPASLGQEVGAALGAQAGQARLTQVLNEGGFSRVRRATGTPFNMVLEARL
ncbi:class I SAM-dependent methyltransferase [Phyllobacterium lublinensis]|uniref:class I SAM-dependent methyltransferase n=1 Tax=Phyllobacterium lublinensis TaxID=2875708 RepID=UPI001CCDECD6|nr:class I SAM-dependent methyltransferase [Phyllobacterium sp. 2063]MBZ9655647.1 class I SAM-dependent methyltransferase [Phyllobacterium sp. 2063]